MQKINKICPIHGELDKTKVNSEGRCKLCRSDYYIKNKDKLRKSARESRRVNKDAINSKIAEDRRNNPEKYRERDRKWRANNLKKARQQDVLQKRNITRDNYEKLIDTQNNLCAICYSEEIVKGRSGEVVPLAIDHCHHCENHIRGLLCHACNTALGKAKDNVEILKLAIKYLASFSGNSDK